MPDVSYLQMLTLCPVFWLPNDVKYRHGGDDMKQKQLLLLTMRSMLYVLSILVICNKGITAQTCICVADSGKTLSRVCFRLLIQHYVPAAVQET